MNDGSVRMLWVIMFGVLGRLVAPLPNFTPMTGLSLFAGSKLGRLQAILLLLLVLLVSDLFLSFMLGYPLIGYFTIFSYSGFIVIAFMGKWIKNAKWSLPFYILGASTFFWLWTNLGVWLTSGLYPKTISGLVMCYYMALPFLRNAMLGDLVWGGLVFFGFYFVNKKCKLLYNSM